MAGFRVLVVGIGQMRPREDLQVSREGGFAVEDGMGAGDGFAFLLTMVIIDNMECSRVGHGCWLSNSGLRDWSVTPLGGSLADLVM